MEELIQLDHARKELNSNQFDPDGIMMGRAAYTILICSQMSIMFFIKKKKMKCLDLILLEK